MKRLIVCVVTLLSANLAGCGGVGPRSEEALGQAEQAILPPYCADNCADFRPCDKECRLEDESRSTCGAFRGCGDDPPTIDPNDHVPPCVTSKPTFSAPAVAEQYEEVTFQADTSNIVGPVNWDFGDATHCVQCDPTVQHAYSALHRHDVVLTATMVGSAGSRTCYETRLSDPVLIRIHREVDPCDKPPFCPPSP
jgi:hypothetical protein